MNFLEIPPTSTVVEDERKNTYLYFMSFYLSLSILKKTKRFLVHVQFTPKNSRHLGIRKRWSSAAPFETASIAGTLAVKPPVLTGIVGDPHKNTWTAIRSR